MSKIYVWSHMDLDGTVAYMVLKWFFKTSIPATFTTANKFKEEFEKFVNSGDCDKYDKIFILDLDVSGHLDLIDRKNIIVFDHHSTDNTEYTAAKKGVKECSSAAKLVYSIFAKLPTANFTDKQKKLIAFADDYDSYTLKSPYSSKLNTIFFQSQNKPWNFIHDFEIGFDGFNQLQKNIIQLNEHKLNRTINELSDIFMGELAIQNQKRIIFSTFASSHINEVADYLIKKYGAEISIVVNPKSNHISFRRAKDSDVDVSKLASLLCNGGGRSETAGGEANNP